MVAGALTEKLETPALRRRDEDLVDLVWDFFVSLRLTIPLLFTLALACTLGTFANPENRPYSEIVSAIGGAWWFKIYLFFELNDLFHSWWFLLLLVLLTFNLSACTIERLPRIFKIALRPDKLLSDRLLRGLKHVQKWTFPADSATGQSADSAQVVGQVMGLLRSQGFHPEVSLDGATDAAYVFAEKGRYSRFGVLGGPSQSLHDLGGALLGRLYGMEGLINVPMDGGTFDYIFRKTVDGLPYRQPLGFTVRVDDFRLKKYLNGNPRSFESDLAVVEHPGTPQSRDLLHKTIFVGEPLVHGGWTFYQASYQAVPEKDEVKLDIQDLRTDKTWPFRISRDGLARLPDGVTFQAINYTQNFADLGPAVQLVRKEGEKATSFWVFQNYPDFDAANRGDRYGLRFQGLLPYYFTGLQVARDPGYPFWLGGCFVLFLGLGIAFYTSHRRLWAKVSKGELILAGTAHKNQAAFEELFQGLVTSLRSVL